MGSNGDLLWEQALGISHYCKHCGKGMITHRKTKQYCNDSCRIMALRRRRHAENPLDTRDGK